MPVLDNRTAIVTGASSGIGLGIVGRFLEEGANVVAVSRDEEALARALSAFPADRVMAIAGDAGDETTAVRAVSEAVGRFGDLHVLVNGVGNASWGDVTRVTPAEWSAVLNSNITSAYLFSRTAIPHLRRTGGVIVQISSVQGSRGDYNSAAYSTSKAAVDNLTRAMALDHAADGIRVNAVAPGFIDTPRTAGAPDERRRALISITPIQRAGTPADVAAAVTFLASDDASFITGVILPVDGGRLAAVNSPRPS